MKLYGYFRSSAAWRVRIALNLKGIAVEHVSRHLRHGEQKAADYLALNPQGLIPALQLDDGTVLTQSLAIIEWLDETHRQPPLLPPDATGRAKVRAFAEIIACDIHPVQNLRVLSRLKALAGEGAGQPWAAEVIAEGLGACETLAAREAGPFCFGAAPTIADLCLVPQLGNAQRFGVDVTRFPRLLAAEAACAALPAFQAAVPSAQQDAEP